MSTLLKILHLEDLHDDAELVARALKKGGLNCVTIHVDNKDDFINSLNESHPDIVLSDHSLPSFDSHEALEIVRKSGLNIPFILVTATVSEEYAVSIIKDGASDYILKDRLQRLPNAIIAAIEKQQLEKERRRSEELLRFSERKYKMLFESNPMPMWMLLKETLDIIAVNDAAVQLYGYSKEEFLNLNSKDLRPEEDVEKYLAHTLSNNSGMKRSGIWRHKKKDGRVIMVEIFAHDLIYEGNLARIVLVNDVTEKLKAEAELAEQRLMQQKLITEVSIKVQERERDEIGKELHDNINQILAASKLYVDMAIKKNGHGAEYLKKSDENITLAISEIRKLSHALVAPSLGEVTLIDATRDLFNDIEEATPLALRLIAGNYKEKEVDKEINLMFYRIIQEQVNNIIKHAHAKNVIVKLDSTLHKINLVIQDDGRGFDSDKTSGGIGLRNIKNRVGFYDGEMRITSSPGQGCRLEVSIPVHHHINT